ncbi:protein-cysteine N-palmitoyltransferase Rasp isoform X2 [Agrilus planipennis]|uniref:Protein-cysteine N-palmitoyltransferase Rasp isoform X2 n=1 Tax=Agrilus planipennis TaxID=224129 RepID=A0A1W4X668_AGRPL|nr:protein-cysteine N-palmitoyltransferase Rasp isoform X2 [Agrilus planipennis]
MRSFIFYLQIFKKQLCYIPDNHGDFKSSYYLTIKRDATDYEWETMTLLIYISLPWIGAHILISEFLREKCEKVLPYWQSIIGLSFLTYMTTLQGSFLVASQLILFELISKFGTIILIWTTCLGYLAAICFFKTFDQTFGYQYLRINEWQHFLLILSLCWMNLRCISFYIETIKCKKNNESNLLRIFSYCFYLPNLFCGPFVHYEEMLQSHNKSTVNLRTRLLILAKDLLRVAWWCLFTHLSLYFLYASAFSLNPKLVKKFNSWALYGYGYWMGQFFHLKYVVFYGFSTSIAKFENVPVPPLPKCIGRIHLYSDMWKYFDRGLHSFLVKYIYVPTLTEKSFIGKTLSSFLCFVFVYIWHGVQEFILVWAILNFIGVTMESGFKSLCLHYEHVIKILNSRWQRRFVCLLASPLLAVSCVSNFYFFAGMNIGNIFADRLFNDSLWNEAVLFFMLYCCCQVSTEINIWEKSFMKTLRKPSGRNYGKTHL